MPRPVPTGSDWTSSFLGYRVWGIRWGGMISDRLIPRSLSGHDRMSVSSDQAREVVEFLEGRGVRVILVGGLAVHFEGGRATEDVDLLVAAREFRRLRERLQGEPRIRTFQSSEGVASFFFRLESRRTQIRVNVLDPSEFSGDQSGDALFDYVWNECSNSLEVGRTANPEFVWYTRRLVKSELYCDRIAEDLENDSPLEWLERAVAIAIRFGTEQVARERALEVLELLGRLGGRRKAKTSVR
jgi:hypothetical protein